MPPSDNRRNHEIHSFVFGAIFARIRSRSSWKNLVELRRARPLGVDQTRRYVHVRSAIKMLTFPNLLILPDKVYSLTIEVSDSMRTAERFLIDHAVKGVNFLDPYDKWTTSFGVSGNFSKTMHSISWEFP